MKETTSTRCAVCGFSPFPPGYQLIAKENCVHAAALQASQVTLGLSSGLDCQLLKDAAAVDLLIIFHLSVYRT